MAKQLMPIVNASRLLTDNVVREYVKAQQIQYDQDFKPAWGDHVPEMEFTFVGMDDIASIPHDAWPIFLNRHSQEKGDLGWHTDDPGNRIFGRVFVGDCFAYGLSWTVDASHEVLETALDPTAQKLFPMAVGRWVPLEVCDAVEDDALSIRIGAVSLSNFVLPPYFSHKEGLARGYDFRGALRAPCPALTAGGYMSIYDADGKETMLQKDHVGGEPSARFLQTYRNRRMKRASNATMASNMVIWKGDGYGHGSEERQPERYPS